MSDRPQWTGRIRKGDAAGTITGWMVDEWGWRLEFVATFDEASREYVLRGTTGEVPKALKVPLVDEGDA